jgi:hypothetical protein
MKKFLFCLLFLVFLTSNISKWYLNIGVNISYYAAPLILWVFLTLVYLEKRPATIPRPIKILILWKVGFLFAILLTVPTVLVTWNSDSMPTFLNGLVTKSLGTTGIIVGLLFATRLDRCDRRRVADLYLVALGLCAVYTLGQAYGAYIANVDLDQVVSARLPFAPSIQPSIEEDVWSMFGATFYRFTGLTGDPNLNAVTFLITLPVLYHQSIGRPSLPFAMLGLAFLAIIAQSLSLTVIPVTLLVLFVLNLGYVRKGIYVVIFTLLGVVGLGTYVWGRGSDVIASIILLRTDPATTILSHIDIARDALKLWWQHPLGVGLNGFAVYSPDFSTHNTYLQVLTELGLVGLLVTVGAVLYSLRVARPTRTPSGFVAFLVVGAISVSAMGHDMLLRFEFEFVMYLLVAFAIMEHREVPLGAPGDATHETRQPGGVHLAPQLES